VGREQGKGRGGEEREREGRGGRKETRVYL